MNNIKTVYSKASGREVKLTEVKASNGQTALVAAEYAPQFQGFINDLEATGYKIKSLGGYADRQNVNSSKSASKHSLGYSIDINPEKNGNFRGVSKAERTKNPSKYTDMPIDTVQSLIKKWGLGWGFNWNSLSDAMHFSVAENEGGKYLALDKGGKPNDASSPTALPSVQQPTVQPLSADATTQSQETVTQPLMQANSAVDGLVANPFSHLVSPVDTPTQSSPVALNNLAGGSLANLAGGSMANMAVSQAQNNSANNNLFSYNPIQSSIARLFGEV